MPWDGTFLRMAKLTIPQGEPIKAMPTIENMVTIAGDVQTAIYQPQFSPDGRYLAFCSDASGWWQIVLHNLKTGIQKQLTHAAAEHGAPAWVQGMRSFTFSGDSNRIYFVRNTQGVESLWMVDIASGEERRLPLDSAYTCLEHITQFDAGGSEYLAFALPVADDRAHYFLQPEGGERVLRRATSEDYPKKLILNRNVLPGKHGRRAGVWFVLPAS
jgi:hypothetical protein